MEKAKKFAYFGGDIFIQIHGKNIKYKNLGACYITKGTFNF